MITENEPPRIIGLERLGLAKLRDPINSYRNLFYHRTVAVELAGRQVCAPMRHTTGIERPWCFERLPSHISKTVVSTVGVGGPSVAVLQTFELVVGL